MGLELLRTHETMEAVGDNSTMRDDFATQVKRLCDGGEHRRAGHNVC